jgi:hypothetical protein
MFQRGIGSIEEDVGIELALKIDEGHPEEIGGRITEGVACFLGKRQFLSVQLHESCSSCSVVPINMQKNCAGPASDRSGQHSFRHVQTLPCMPD